MKSVPLDDLASPISDVLDVSACRDDAQQAWKALAGGIAGQPRMRLSRDGGKSYPRRYERAITDQLPNQPAAVLVYDKSGCGQTLCVDLDVSKGGREAVERDYSAVCAILSRLGLRFFADQSPNGGIHLYVPLAEPVPFGQARAVALALAARTPTMDPMPMLGITDGCIRPPGARHKSGGHQQLIGSLAAAYDATMRRNTPQTWQRLVDEYGADDIEHNSNGSATDFENALQLSPLGRYTEPDANFQHIARTGHIEPGTYPSPSEARQAVIWSAVASGWAITDVQRRLHDGTWPGLASLYARYRPDARTGALKRDWNSAIRHEKQRRKTQGSRTVRSGTTSAPNTHAQLIYQQIRTWHQACLLACAASQLSIAQRTLLRALAEAAMKKASLTIAFGNRSLAIASGANQSTVGKILNQLADAEEPLIRLVEEASGVNAHTYELLIPESIQPAAQRRAWSKGKIHGLRPAFRELGRSAAFLYETLEQAGEPLSGRELTRRAQLSPAAGKEALETLHAFGLAQKTRTGWKIGAASLATLAEQFGITDQIKAQIDQYRTERRAYWAYLGIVRLTDADEPVGYYDTGPPPPPDIAAEQTLLGMLENLLGVEILVERPCSGQGPDQSAVG